MIPELERIDSEIQAAESALRAGGTPEANYLLWLKDLGIERRLIMAEFSLFSRGDGRIMEVARPAVLEHHEPQQQAGERPLTA